MSNELLAMLASINDDEVRIRAIKHLIDIYPNLNLGVLISGRV